MLIDASGIYLSSSRCLFTTSIVISNMLQQLRSLAGIQCAAAERWKRREDMEFTQVLNMHDQCGQPVDRTLRRYPRLRVGSSPCTDTHVDESIGRWEFDCTFPGSESGSMRCQSAIQNDVVDFLITDPFGGNCPDIVTIITTLGIYGNDFLSASSFRSVLHSKHLEEGQRGGADHAAAAFGRLWEVFHEMLSTSASDASTGSSALEQYIDTYNEHRNFVSDICEDLHAGEIPFNLSLTVGATHIDRLTTINWAPVRTRPYNITVQNPSAIACCPNGAVAQHDGEKCGYPASATIHGTSCICGTTAGGTSVGFEYVECDNFVSECNSDHDCENAGHTGFVCLIGSCCGGGVCIDPYACSQDGIDLVSFGG
ncbi:hypothetical protein BGZ63DRAFT_391783 [Mariannaea sp. PMI_226]|nr:hypothetical protein BGZ63DRAFT_391783 [Mariannaea sp. PMI_226]